MRAFLILAFFAGVASIAAAQDFRQLDDNPVIFQQPEEPPRPQPPPPPPEVKVFEVAPEPAPAPEPERENVSGREETDHEQHLFDQWNAPGQTRGGTAIVTLVE